MADLSTNKPTENTEVAALRALLDAVLDAITLPSGSPDHDQRLLNRALWVRATVKGALAEDPADLGWNVDYLRSKLAAEQARADERATNLCGRCHRPFDPTDTRFDGHARHGDTPWCRQCIDNCHEGSPEHACRICDPKRYGGEGR
ncbi:hypothetical protein [Streptomyces sp. NPDC086182]|uniref:hypothetical protein n=1 Tax=Streptomyces sp. NPDC086182 TaxID=3155058 RepID=UPI003441A3BD